MNLTIFVFGYAILALVVLGSTIFYGGENRKKNKI